MGPVSEVLVPAELLEDEVLLVLDEVLHDRTPCEVLLISVVVGPQHEVGDCRHHAERHARDSAGCAAFASPDRSAQDIISRSSQHGESTSKLTNDSSEQNSKPNCR